MLSPSQDFHLACLPAFHIYTLIAILAVAVFHVINVDALEETFTPLVDHQKFSHGIPSSTRPLQDIDHSNLKLIIDGKLSCAEGKEYNHSTERGLIQNELDMDKPRMQPEERKTDIVLPDSQNLHTHFSDLKSEVSNSTIIPSNQDRQLTSDEDILPIHSSGARNSKQDDILQSTHSISDEVLLTDLNIISYSHKKENLTSPLRDSSTQKPFSASEKQSLNILELNCSALVNTTEDLKKETKTSKPSNIDLPMNVSLGEESKPQKITDNSNQFITNTGQPGLELHHKSSDTKQARKVERNIYPGEKSKHTLRYAIGNSLCILISMFITLGLCLLLTYPIPFNFIQNETATLISRETSPAWMQRLPENRINSAQYPFIDYHPGEPIVAAAEE